MNRVIKKASLARSVGVVKTTQNPGIVFVKVELVCASLTSLEMAISSALWGDQSMFRLGGGFVCFTVEH